MTTMSPRLSIAQSCSSTHAGEAGGVDRLIKGEGRINPVAAQRGDEGLRLPVAVRHLGMEPLSNRCPAAQRCHIDPFGWMFAAAAQDRPSLGRRLISGDP